MLARQTAGTIEIHIDDLVCLPDHEAGILEAPLNVGDLEVAFDGAVISFDA